MPKCSLAAVLTMLVSIPLEAQESLWSATMTAGKGEAVGPEGTSTFVGYARYPEVGKLSDADFDFRGITYGILGLVVVEPPTHSTDAQKTVAISFTPPLDHQHLELMTLTLDGRALHVRDAYDVSDYSDDPPTTTVNWIDPGLEWADGQRIDAGLTIAQQVASLPLAAAGLLALLLGVSSYRRIAVRNRPETPAP